MLVITCLLDSLMSCASVGPPLLADLASRLLHPLPHQACLVDHAGQSVAGWRLEGGQGGRPG